MASPQLENYVTTAIRNVTKELPVELSQACKREVTNARLDRMNFERMIQAVEDKFSDASKAMGKIGISGVLINAAVCTAASALLDRKGTSDSKVMWAVDCFKKIIDGILSTDTRKYIESRISMAAEAVLEDSSIAPVVSVSSPQAWISFRNDVTNTWFGFRANIRTDFDHIADALKDLPSPGCTRAKNYREAPPVELGVLGQRESIGKMLFQDMLNLKAFGNSIAPTNLVPLLDNRIVCHLEPKPLPVWVS